MDKIGTRPVWSCTRIVDGHIGIFCAASQCQWVAGLLAEGGDRPGWRGDPGVPAIAHRRQLAVHVIVAS